MSSKRIGNLGKSYYIKHFLFLFSIKGNYIIVLIGKRDHGIGRKRLFGKERGREKNSLWKEVHSRLLGMGLQVFWYNLTVVLSKEGSFFILIYSTSWFSRCI